MAEPEDRVAALERRVVDLEIRAAFQARTIEELDEVVRQFAGRVEAVERVNRALRALVPGDADTAAQVRALLMKEAVEEEAEP